MWIIGCSIVSTGTVSTIGVSIGGVVSVGWSTGKLLSSFVSSIIGSSTLGLSTSGLFSTGLVVTGVTTALFSFLISSKVRYSGFSISVSLSSFFGAACNACSTVVFTTPFAGLPKVGADEKALPALLSVVFCPILGKFLGFSCFF